jgi:glutathionyl-hydroquinone reductase
MSHPPRFPQRYINPALQTAGTESSTLTAPSLQKRIATISTSVCHHLLSINLQAKPLELRTHSNICPGFFCPFAHRVNIVRHLYDLQDVLPISIVKPYPKGDEKGWPGWRFVPSLSSGQEKGNEEEYPGATVDRVFGASYLHEVYFKADPDYKGRYSVPCLWDQKSGTIVGNESAEILRWLPQAFDSILPADARQGKELDLYPEHLREKIDRIGLWMQRDLHVGVYKAGFAPDQATYDKNVIPVFGALNALEKIIHRNGGPYILGKEMTELDIRAYATVVRFDVVYVQHFKCNLGTVRHNYPQVNNWLKNLYWNHPAFKETTNFKHIKENVSSNIYFCFDRPSSLSLTSFAQKANARSSTRKATTTSIPKLSRQWVRIRTSKRGFNRTFWGWLLVVWTGQTLLSMNKSCYVRHSYAK